MKIYKNLLDVNGLCLAKSFTNYPFDEQKYQSQTINGQLFEFDKTFQP